MGGVGDVKAGVVGTGFIGVVHVDALRRIGVDVKGVVGSSPERAGAKGIAPVYRSYEELLADGEVDPHGVRCFSICAVRLRSDEKIRWFRSSSDRSLTL